MHPVACAMYKDASRIEARRTPASRVR
jgi:hypothetical protein